MTELMERALAQVSKLPVADRDGIAARIPEKIEDERCWAELFAHPKSPSPLERLAEEALEEGRRGEAA